MLVAGMVKIRPTRDIFRSDKRMDLSINADLIDHLRETSEYYEIVYPNLRDSRGELVEPKWKRKKEAYFKAINTLKDLNWSVVTAEDAMKLRWISHSISSEIEEFALTGTTQKLERMKALAGDAPPYIDLFKSVFGVGIMKALELYKSGYRSLEDIPGRSLTYAQRLGLEHYDDLRQPIPRYQITQIDARILSPIRITYPDWTVDITGSYRRGATVSSDIDILVTGTDMDTFLNKLAPLHLVSLAKGKRKFMGLCTIEDVTRRIDVRVFDREHYPTAMLYFTGSARFNVLMRERANSLTFLLSEYGLYYADGERAEVYTEADIFLALDVAYLAPAQRGDNLSALTTGTTYDQLLASLPARKALKKPKAQRKAKEFSVTKPPFVF